MEQLKDNISSVSNPHSHKRSQWKEKPEVVFSSYMALIKSPQNSNGKVHSDSLW
jgi:hypothetical protein